MKFRFLTFTLLVLCITLFSCAKDTPDFEEKVKEEIPVASENTDTSITDQEKAERQKQLYNEISNMSIDERANDFIKALNSGDVEKIGSYINSNSIEEFSKAKFNAEIVNVREKSDISYVEYQADVKLTVTESETVAFKNGTFDYALLIRDFPDPSFVVYFGPCDRLNIIKKENIPTKDNLKLYNAYWSVMPLFNYISSEPTEEKMHEATRFEVAHAVVHAIIPYFTEEIFLTKEEFKKLANDIYGIEDIEVLEWLDFKYPCENGVYSIYCAHDMHITFQMYDGMKETENGIKLTFSLYSDSAYTVKCATLTVTFAENENSDFMRVVDIDLEKHLDNPVYTFAP